MELDGMVIMQIKLIDELQFEVQLTEACFGRYLDSDSEHKILLFKNAFLSLQETAFSLGKTLTVSWKIRIICCRVFPFFKSMQDAACQSMQNSVVRRFMQSLSLHGKDINVI